MYLMLANWQIFQACIVLHHNYNYGKEADYRATDHPLQRE